MKNPTASAILSGNKRLAASIAFAEAASSVVSIGAVIATMHKPELVAPIQHFVADRIVYPVMKAMNSEQLPEDALREKANERGSLLTKGAVMVGTGFASHLPIQLAMNGGFHMKEFKQAALGKSIETIA